VRYQDSRDAAEIEETVSTRLGDGESAEQFVQRCRALEGLGAGGAGRWRGWASSTRSCCAPDMDRGRAGHAAAARPLLDRADRAG